MEVLLLIIRSPISIYKKHYFSSARAVYVSVLNGDARKEFLSSGPVTDELSFFIYSFSYEDIRKNKNIEFYLPTFPFILQKVRGVAMMVTSK